MSTGRASSDADGQGTRPSIPAPYPAAIEVDIEGWRHALEPGDDPDALGQQFSGWADEAMTEAKAQAARRRLRIGGRLPARHVQIESRWEMISRAGQETVYEATVQANRFFQRWQQEIAAAGRCVDLLRAQPGGGCGDAPRAGPGPEPAVKLPD